MTHRLTGLVATLTLLSLAACGGDDSPTGPGDGQASVDRIEVTPGADTLTAVGNSQQFEALALTSGGDTVTGVDFSWSSTDSNVATVSDQGVAEAVANGDAEIRANAEGVTGSAPMAVIQQVSSVSISPSSATLATVEDTTRFSASATDENGNAVSDAEFVWQSENHAVATVDSSGLATSQGNGETAITVTAQDVPAHATLTVNQAISQLAFRTQPTSATAGQAIDPAVQVAVLDSAGNVVENAENAVTLSIGTNPGGGSLGGTTTVNAVNGVATFSGLWIDMAATGYTLQASVSGVSSSPTSQTFDISAAEASQLAFRTQPSATEGQRAISPAVEVEVQDEFGNFVSSSSPRITLSLAREPYGNDASLSGTTTLTASSGVATFSNISLARPGPGYTLGADAFGLESAVSDTFSIELTFVKTTAGGDHTCGITVDNHAYCWGESANGQLGNGTTSLDSVPEPVSGGYAFKSISAGGQHTCGLTTSDQPLCWGGNSNGQLGDGTTTDRSTPVAVSTSNSYAQISAGEVHTCGITTGDEPFCWGDDTHGQLGSGGSGNTSSPVAVVDSALSTQTWSQLSAGKEHTCGITATDKPYCWGDNFYGELGDNSTNGSNTPVAVDVSGLSTQTFSQISAAGGSRNHTCALTTADEPYCWGANSQGQIGDGTTSNDSVPVPVDVSSLPTQTFAQIDVGGEHSCGISTADEPYCWGYNFQGQIGASSSDVRLLTPTAVSDFNLTTGTFGDISAGVQHSTGVTTDSVATAWGDGDHGELGVGYLTDAVAAPVIVIQ